MAWWLPNANALPTYGLTHSLCSTCILISPLAIKSLQSLSHCEFVAANAKQDAPNSDLWRNTLLWCISSNLPIKNNTWIKTYGLGIHTSEVESNPGWQFAATAWLSFLGHGFFWFCFCIVVFFVVCLFLSSYSCHGAKRLPREWL